MTTASFKITGLEKVTLNGRRAQIFSLREKIGGAWVYRGAFSAPARMRKTELIDHALQTRETYDDTHSASDSPEYVS